MDLEKRAYARLHTHVDSVIEVHGQRIYSTIFDVSEGGVGLICAPELKNGEIIELSIDWQVGSMEKSCSVLIEVVRCLKDKFECTIGTKVRSGSQGFTDFLEQVRFDNQQIALQS